MWSAITRRQLPPGNGWAADVLDFASNALSTTWGTDSRATGSVTLTGASSLSAAGSFAFTLAFGTKISGGQITIVSGPESVNGAFNVSGLVQGQQVPLSLLGLMGR
jgi:hypothetical protein